MKLMQIQAKMRNNNYWFWNMSITNLRYSKLKFRRQNGKWFVILEAVVSQLTGSTANSIPYYYFDTKCFWFIFF
jgi:hypothetical protein